MYTEKPKFTQGPEEAVALFLTPEIGASDEAFGVATHVGRAVIDGRVMTSFSEQDRQPITLDLAGTTPEIVDAMLAERTSSPTIRPDFVLPHQVQAPEVYARLGDQEKKDTYRSALRHELMAAWRTELGDETAERTMARFNQLSGVIQEDGALVVGDMISKGDFSKLVSAYTKVMDDSGSVSLLHSYANLRNQPGFLANSEFNDAFFSPLSIALISERVGGAIRVVDARAKNAGKIEAQAQDNMLHVDNTPFRDEYKVLLVWEKDKPSGPKGQNFVFLPGTHKGVRNCLVGADGEPYSTENASIFITPEDVAQAFDLQGKMRKGGSTVVEIQDRDRPLTTMFPSGSIVHHRLRTKDGSPRSSMIIAFHRTSDTPGEFIADPGLRDDQVIEKALFGYGDNTSDEGFSRMLAGYAPQIATKINEIYDDSGGAVVIDPQAKTLSPQQMTTWYRLATSAPKVEEIKQTANYFVVGEQNTPSEFMSLLTTMMEHDKHGPIDMILYADGHEEPRKWARNRIREMKLEDLQARLMEWQDQIAQPTVSDILSPAAMQEVTDQLASNAASITAEERLQGRLPDIERITPTEAYRSVAQLIVDLGENLSRADERQTYLSASLFQFWAADELNRLKGGDDPQLRALGGRLLRHYIATATLIEKQIAHHNSIQSARR